MTGGLGGQNLDNGIERGKNATVAAIGPGITITGDVESTVEMQISGRIDGNIRCQTLFLDESGSVAGSIRAERVRVSGTIDGDIDTVDLAIEPTGRVSGAVTYARLKVSPGGIMHGSMSHRAAEASGVEPGNLKLVEDADRGPPRRVFGD